MRLLRGHTDKIFCLAYSPDGRLVAAGAANDSLKLFDLASGREQATWAVQQSKRPVTAVTFLDGRTVASVAGCASPNHDSEVRLWDLATGYNSVTLTGRSAYYGDEESDPLTRPVNSIACLAYEAATRTLAVGVLPASVKLWSLAEGRWRAPSLRHGWGLRCVAFSADGRWLATGGDDETVRVWDVTAGGTLQATLPHRGVVRAVAFAPDGPTLVTVVGSVVRFWNVRQGQEQTVLKGHTQTVSSLAFSPDGRTLATASHDRLVRFWDMSTATERVCYDWKVGKLHAVAFAPDGLTAAAAGDGRVIVVWDVDERMF